MALTKASVLHYFSSRYGINPRIGGRPVYTRNSAGIFTTQEGEMDTAIVNTPRFDWATLNLPSGQTERRKVLTLEMAKTNLVDADFSSWTVNSVTVTPGQGYDPAGGAAASLLNATVAGGEIKRTVAFTANETKGVSCRLKAGSAAASYLGIWSNTAAAWRARVDITWTAGVPTLAVGSGAATLWPVRPLQNGWYEIQFGAQNVVAADTNLIYLYPAGGGTGTVFAFKPQAENGPTATSMINGFSTTRAADSLYWNYQSAPQAKMVYLRFVERGSILSGTPGVLFGALTGEPVLQMYASGAFYTLYHGEGGAGAVSATLAVTPAIGQTVELVGILFSDGSVQIIQSLDGAAITNSGQSAVKTIGAAWSDSKLYMNAAGATVGANGYAEVKVVKYADVVGTTAADRMSELRAFELGPQGDVL